MSKRLTQCISKLWTDLKSLLTTVTVCFMLLSVVIVLKCCFLLYFLRHVASFLSVFKLLVIGLIIIGRDPFALLGMQAPGIWEWGQGNKVRVPGTVGVNEVI